MALNGLKSGKFSEELYFILMSAPLRQRIEALGSKYGLSPRQLRSQVIKCADQFGNRLDQSHQHNLRLHA
jgi:hypothetical protein